jgi:uncharacterized cupin superfamily protein
MSQKPIPARSVPAQQGKSIYPAPFASLVSGRTKRKLGDVFGLSNFGVNLTELAPGAISALIHCHSKQDEFLYVLEGTPTLKLGSEAFTLGPGDCCGFKAGTGVAHHLVNESGGIVRYLEVGDRSPGDEAEYPFDDLRATLLSNGVWQLTRKDGSAY